MKRSYTFWGMALVLWFFWIAITASFNWQSLLVGIFASLLVTSFNSEELITPSERALINLKNIILYIRYAFEFFIAVFVANFQVAALVLNPKLPIEPDMIPVNINLKKDMNRVIFANSVTLTPGTLSVLCNEEDMLVHVLTKKNGEDLKNWRIINYLRDTEDS